MKHLLLSLIFSASLTAFSQVSQNTVTTRDVVKPDTIRAICLVTLFENGIAHARMGWVVIAPDKRPVFLDCRKRALKYPQVGWGFREVDPNVNQK